MAETKPEYSIIELYTERGTIKWVSSILAFVTEARREARPPSPDEREWSASGVCRVSGVLYSYVRSTTLG